MLTSPVLLLNSSLFILSNIVNTSLYIATPENVSECYVALDYHNNFYNNSYPTKWRAMKIEDSALTGGKCVYSLTAETDSPPDYLNYKVKYVFNNRSVYELKGWQSIFWKIQDYELKKSNHQGEPTVIVKNGVKQSTLKVQNENEKKIHEAMIYSKINLALLFAILSLNIVIMFLYLYS